jgi:hypothetical protein
MCASIAELPTISAEHGRATVRFPWLENPCTLITWWDMEKFAAEEFCRICSNLSGMSEFYLSNEVKPLEMDVRVAVASRLSTAVQTCRQIGLEVTARQIEANVDVLLSHAGFVTGIQLSQILACLGQALVSEMSIHLFMRIVPKQAAYYSQPELFGKDVNAKFPSIQFDLVEAGNCYATGRSTATVFHLMRIMEIGVQQFGAKLGVPLVNEKVWQVILDGINKAIKTLPAKDPNTIQMLQAANNLYAVKVVWRNDVMHPNDTYTAEEAENLIQQVKIFMEQLAMIV